MDKSEAIIAGFVSIMEEDGSSSAIEAIRNKAFAKLTSGEAKTLVSTSLNSKSFSYNVSMPAEELFGLAAEAIRKFNSGIVRVTEPDFSGI